MWGLVRSHSAPPLLPLAESGERKGRAGWARPAGPIPCSRGPEVARPRAHPTTLWSLVCCGAGLAEVGERGTWRNDHLCASGRGHLRGTPRKCAPGGVSTAPPDARPHPLSRQSTVWSATHRFSGSALPLMFPPFVQTGEGRPRSPREGAAWWAGLLQSGVSPPLSPGATDSGMVPTSPTDRVKTVIDGTSCLRSRAGSDKKVTKERSRWGGC